MKVFLSHLHLYHLIWVMSWWDAEEKKDFKIYDTGMKKWNKDQFIKLNRNHRHTNTDTQSSNQRGGRWGDLQFPIPIATQVVYQFMPMTMETESDGIGGGGDPCRVPSIAIEDEKPTVYDFNYFYYSWIGIRKYFGLPNFCQIKSLPNFKRFLMWDHVMSGWESLKIKFHVLSYSIIIITKWGVWPTPTSSLCHHPSIPLDAIRFWWSRKNFLLTLGFSTQNVSFNWTFLIHQTKKMQRSSEEVTPSVTTECSN